ncbi:putative ribonuclease H-like domain-containing protein [Tanacetum coccineum]
MSIDDLYNNFKIVEQSVKKSVGASSGAQNLAFMTAPSTSSTNDVNTAKPAYEVSTASPNVNTTTLKVSTTSFNDLEAMDLKWQLSLLSMRAKRYYQRTGKKIFINANDTAGYDKSKVECFNCHKMGHFARKCRASRNKEGQFRNQDNTRKHGNNEDTSSKAMLAIDGVDFDWSDMAEEKLDLSYSGLDEFKDPEFKIYGSEESKQESNIVSEDTSSIVESPLNVDKETVFLADKKIEFVKPKNHEKSVKKSVRTHPNAQRNMVPRAVLMKTGLKPFNTARTVNTAHLKSTVFSAKPMSLNTARPKAVNTARLKAVNTARPHSAVVNVVRVNQANAGKPLMEHMTGNIAYLSDFKEFDGGYVIFRGGAHGDRISGKQHRASCKSKVLNPITKPLFMLHMDLFGLTFVSSLMHKKYCLVVTDDYSRFTWVFFLTTKDETSEILKNFIKEIENLVDKKVEIIRSDNGTEFKNKVMDDFCREKGKFDDKSDEGFFVGYSLSSKAFKVYNTRTRRVEENLHIGFLENKPMIEGNSPKWLFDIDSLTQSTNYVPVAIGTVTNESAGIQGELNAGTSTQKEEISQDCIVMPIWKDASYFDSPSKDVGNGDPKSTVDDQKQVEDGPDNENDEKDKSEDDNSPKEVNTAGQHVNTASPEVNTASPEVNTASPEVNTCRFKLNTIDPSVNTASSSDPDSPKYIFTMGASHTLEATHVEFFSDEDEPEVNLGNILNSYTIEPTSIAKALSDSSWVEAMQEELLQFKLQQGHRQEEGTDYEEVFAPVARIETIRLFLAYASFMGFLVYQMDVKSSFLYGTIEEEVYVDDIIFGSTNKELCTAFEKLMKDKFQMSSMGELTFFLGLQVQQKEDGIFINQDKYIAEILKKFNYTDVKSASTQLIGKAFIQR